jgi:hypothetical protein
MSSAGTRSEQGKNSIHLRLLHWAARFMPECGQMISSQQKIVGGNHDKSTDLS